MHHLIALGVSLFTSSKKIICLDGDGASIMHMGAMSIIGSVKPINLIHIVLNNGSHESVGGQPTVGKEINFANLAEAFKYSKYYEINTLQELSSLWTELHSYEGPTLVNVNIDSSSRDSLGRPESTALENKVSFMEYLTDDKHH